MIAHWHLVWAEFGRNRGRTLLTLASIATAFFLFGLLDAVRMNFAMVGESAHGARRLITSARLSLTEPLPLALADKIAAIDGVTASAHASWFGAYYQHHQNQVAAYAISDSYFTVYPEIEVDPWAQYAFKNTPNAVLAGEGIAQRFGWEVGQSIPVGSSVFFDRAGNNHWEFVIVGILRTNKTEKMGFYANMLLLRQDFVSEVSPYLDGWVGWYVSTVRDVSTSGHVANLIDRLSLNSSHETRTMSEQAAFSSQLRQWADVELMTRSIMGAVFFSLLCVTSSVLVHSVRERKGELALLQALGFSRVRIGALILVEAMLSLLTGGLTGLALAAAGAWLATQLSGGMLVLPVLNLTNWGVGVLLMLGVGLGIGLIPVLRYSGPRLSHLLSRR